ncbi:hypothetical protein ACHQM5_003997 [Ranunculus cassubicifolius]
MIYLAPLKKEGRRVQGRTVGKEESLYYGGCIEYYNDSTTAELEPNQNHLVCALVRVINCSFQFGFL